MSQLQLELGEKIRNFRKRAGLSQLDLEVLTNVSPGTISRIENGQVNPTKETLVKIAQALELGRVAVGELFGIEISDSLEPILTVNYQVFKSLELDQVLQASVDQIVKELNLFSCFITLVEGDRLYAYTATNHWPAKLTKKILKRDIKGLSVSLKSDDYNLMARAVIENKPIHSNELHRFLYPAINKNLALLLERIIPVKSCIAFPIVFEEKVIGAIMFGKSTEEDYSKEMRSIIEFCKHIGLAINNAKQYAKLKEELAVLKASLGSK